MRLGMLVDVLVVFFSFEYLVAVFALPGGYAHAFEK